MCVYTVMYVCTYVGRYTCMCGRLKTGSWVSFFPRCSSVCAFEIKIEMCLLNRPGACQFSKIYGQQATGILPSLSPRHSDYGCVRP